MPTLSYKGKTEKYLKEAGPAAAKYYRDVANGSVAKPNPQRVATCKDILGHVVGSHKPKGEEIHDRGAPIRITNVIVVKQEPQHIVGEEVKVIDITQDVVVEEIDDKAETVESENKEEK